MTFIVCIGERENSNRHLEMMKHYVTFTAYLITTK